MKRDNANSGKKHDGSQQKEMTPSNPCGRFRSIVHGMFNRETLLYGVFGILTTLLNLGLFRLLLFVQINYKLANIITLIVVKLVAYIVNKVFVFHSHTTSAGVLLKEFFRYFVTRGFTMLIDYFGLIMLVDLLGLGEMAGKCIMTVTVVILNYFLGKYIVFTGQKPIDIQEERKMETTQPEGNYYNKYQSKSHIEQDLVNNFFSAMDAMLCKIAPITSLFDAGCGEGHVTRHLRDLLHPEIMLASDISERLISENRMLSENDGITYSCGSIYDTGLRSDSIELVCASEVIEHLEDPGRAIAELFRVSCKYVWISVPNEPIWRIANCLRGKYMREWGNTPGHVQHYSVRSLCRQIESACECSVVLLEKRSPFPWIQVVFEKLPG